MMKKIVLCPNPARDHRFEYTLKIYELLKKSEADVIICPLFEKYGSGVLPGGVKVGNMDEHIKSADIIIAFGGDGTIMTVSRFAAPYGIPIIGVNMGHKGFIAEFEKSETDLILAAAFEKFQIEKRMMMDVTVRRGGKIIHTDFLLNDVVIRGISRLINLSVYGDGKEITSFSGDGVVIATPTGSTAYSLSAGGPIVEPWTENIVITPVCAHTFKTRPMVLGAGRMIDIKVGRLNNKSAYISVDGGASVPLKGGDVIKVCKSQYVTRLVHIPGRDFYRKISEKFGEK